MLGIFLDTETNGLNVKKHHVIEIAYQIINLNSGKVLDRYETIVSPSNLSWSLSDPKSLEVNGFSLEEIKQGKGEQLILKEIVASFKSNRIQRGQAVFICQNPSFDRAFFNQIIDADIQEELHWPYHWLDLASMYFARCLIEKKVLLNELKLSKNTIAQAFDLPEESNPHRAMNGVKHLILCYEAVIGFPQI